MTRTADRESIVYDLDDEYRALLAEGMTASQARRWYRRQVWGSTLPLLRSRWSARGGGLRGSWALDLRLAVRMGWKNPGLTAVTIFALAIGIPLGLAPTHAASIFELPPTVPDGADLYIVKNYDRRASDWGGASLPDYRVWADRLESFEALGAVRRTGFNLRVRRPGDDGTRGGPAVEGAELSAGALAILRTPPLLGRLPTPDDERVGAPRVALLSHDLWRDRLAADPAVLGSTVEIGGAAHTVVGVMPTGFHFPYRAQIWVPRQQSATTLDDGNPWIVFGRLAAGASPETADTEAAGVGAAVDPDAPERAEWLRPSVVPFTPGLFGVGRGGLAAEQGFYLVQALALFVLVVACLNIGMLMLVRTLSRSREIAVRTALGASRGRVVAQLFLEALVLAVAAAGVGLLLAEFASQRLHFMERLLPYWLDFGIRPSTVAQALGLAVVSAAVVGIVPALKVTGHSVHRNIQRASAARTGVRFGGVSSVLIVADVALAVVAVGIALGFSDDLRAVGGIEPTLAADEYLSASFGLPAAGRRANIADPTVRRAEAENALIDRLLAEPVVRSVAVASTLPGMDTRNRRFEILGDAAAEYDDARQSALVHIRPGYFRALDQPLASGRTLALLDAEEATAGVVVNTQFVTEFFQGRDPVGRRVREVGRTEGDYGPWLEIVGTVGEIRRSHTERREGPLVYRAARPGELERLAIALHIGDDPAAFVPRLRDVAHEVDPMALIDQPMPLSAVESFDDNVLRWFALGVQVMITILIGMAASGTYALLSFTLRERVQEIAVRSALGSPRGAVLWTIGRRALMQIGVGALIGMVVTATFYHLSTRSGWVPVVPPVLMTLGAGVTVIVGVGLLAFVGPMRRGMAIEPARALQG